MAVTKESGPIKYGKTNIKIQVPGGTLLHLGEADDMVQISEVPFFHDVPGDANGGPQGPPIEIQDLGSIVQIRFTLSRVATTPLDLLRKRGRATLGQMTDAEVGEFILEKKYVRLLLHNPNRPQNFVCCLVRSPIGYGIGTKYSGFDFQFEAHRAPPGHPKCGVIQNTETG